MLNIKKYLMYGALISLSVCTWSKFFYEWWKLHKKYKEHLLFLQRHNCIVSYCVGKMGGWSSEGVKVDKWLTLQNQYEPVLYFIRTAKYSLDIAVMILSVECITDEILLAFKRKVNVRIIVDLNYNRNSTLLLELSRAGIPILYYDSPNSDVNSIFHCKYMVKDYSSESGYLFVASLNFCSQSVVSNYESITFTMHHYLLTEFKNNFESSWRTIREMNGKRTLH
ncbi:hypothetical protein RI129_011517 [Pyrocoelia pectoralis]|uniref:Mitochondrial cardiolipin hydrolase n=1 Tax=Pyrocoelia pectoralis TaxID=417401 RepID=A0AAN7UWC4_9COLE